MNKITVKRKLAALAAGLVLVATGSVVAAPTAEAALGYSPCTMAVNSWGGSASVKCNYGSYRIGVYCSWWTGGSTTRNSAWSVPAPKLAVAYCPFGSKLTNAGAFWSDGRLIGFWK